MAPTSEIPGNQPTVSFAVVPVLDLKDGGVVHARAGKQAHAGKRADYRPIATPFGPPHDAPAIARALLGITFSPVLYIADLDSILGRGNNFELVRALADAVPETDLWIDAGFSNLDDCAFWLPLGATLVVGSETIGSLEDWKAMCTNFGRNLVLSLDFDEQGLRGPKELMSQPDLWPERVILMSLGRVGTETGPDLDLLRKAIASAGDRHVYVAGGIATKDDVATVMDAGARGVLVATALHSGAIGQKEIAALWGGRRS
ncbi:HisA/HisF-related TIM barrel protein [Methyloceanibacter sp. wino2]|uniref:HisA/HisF-related TIM barrel protein n=1 Tax=Methyloceanibacter sp. wino2 TaxID=2170729 RepID=UPI000D3E9BD0|nr:HisA/HisF-related TIM barrel protein [Methyloceanibacter sp. wino2]